MSEQGGIDGLNLDGIDRGRLAEVSGRALHDVTALKGMVGESIAERIRYTGLAWLAAEGLSQEAQRRDSRENLRAIEGLRLTYVMERGDLDAVIGSEVAEVALGGFVNGYVSGAGRRLR